MFTTVFSLFKFLGGYLQVELSGYAPERFLNLCCNHNILIWNLSKCGDNYRFYLSIRAFWQIRPFLQKTKTKIRIIQKTGFPFWMKKYRKRKLFFAGILLAFLLVGLMSQFIWNIEVQGNSRVTDETVLDFLDRKDYGFGEWKHHLDCEQIEKELRNEFSEIIWASARISGTKMTIDIKENLVPREKKDEPATEASDLVADKHAVVDSVLVRSGTPMVSAGEEVTSDDVLVSGRIDIKNDAGEVVRYQYCNADADVYLITEYEYSDVIPVRYEVKNKTGRKKKSYEAELFGRKLPLGMGKVTFSCFEKTTDYHPLKLNENFYLPFVLCCYTYEEYEIQQKNHTKEELEAIAQENLNIYLEELSEKEVQILEKNAIIDMDENFCRVSGVIKVREKASVRQETERLTLPADDERLATDELE